MAGRRTARERPSDDAPKSTGGVEKERYRAEAGRQDLITIVCKPRWTPKHYTGKFYLQCLDREDAPCCEHFGSPSPSSTAYVIHVASRKKSMDWTIVGKPKIWGFGDDKWAQYQTILRDHFDDDFSKMRKALISVSCQDTERQKLFLSVYPKKDVQLTREMFELASEKKDMFEDDTAVDEQDVLHTITTLTGGHGGGSKVEDEESEPTPPEDEPPLDEAKVEDQIDDVIAGWEE